MNWSAFLLSITITTVSGVACTDKDGTGKADSANCECGEDGSGGALQCTETDNNCYLPDGDVNGACLADCVDDTAAADVTGANQVNGVCRCGDTDGEYIVVADDHWCLVVNNKAEQLDAAITTCATVNGSAATDKGCTCGNATCLNTEFCDASSNTCFSSRPYAACPTTQDHTDRCTCGSDKVCKNGEHCSVDGGGLGTCAAITDCSGDAAVTTCNCGDTWINADADQFCFVDGNGVGHTKGAAFAACTGIDVNCKCGTAYCEDMYCDDNTACASLPAPCEVTNGGDTSGDAAACVCTDKVCAAATACGSSGGVHTCHASGDVTECVDGAVNAETTTCACGKTAVCDAQTDTTSHICYKGGLSGNGECLAAACANTDGFAADAAACFCGDKSCPTTHNCLQIPAATEGGAATYDCVLTAIGTHMKAAQDQAVATAQAGCFSEDDCPKKDCPACDDADDDDSAGSASCIGSFVTTMATAMNNL